MIITRKLLNDVGACSQSIAIMNFRFPNGFDMTVDNIIENYEFLTGINARWLINTVVDEDKALDFDSHHYLFCSCPDCMSFTRKNPELVREKLEKLLPKLETELDRWTNH